MEQLFLLQFQCLLVISALWPVFLIPLIKISLICILSFAPSLYLFCVYIYVCMYMCACVYTSSGLGLGRDNEIITLIKPLQTEWSSLFCSFSRLCLLLVFAACLSASALVSQADSLTDSSCQSDATASARDAVLLKHTVVIQLWCTTSRELLILILMMITVRF